MNDLPPVPRDDLPPPPPPAGGPATPPTSPEAVASMAVEMPAQRNALALVAFAISVLGFCVPVLPSGLALVLGLVAVFRRPRGFAIAALALGALQLAGWIVGIGLLVSSARAQAQSRTNAMMALAAALAAEREDGVDRFPIGGAPQFSAVDGWGANFRVEVLREHGRRSVLIQSAGPDGVFDTEDDFVAASDAK